MRRRGLTVGGLLLLACGGVGGERAQVEHPPEATVQVELAVLDAVAVDLLEQHLTASAAWTVQTERGRRIATRNWLQAGRWVPGSNGYWSDFSQDAPCPTAAVPLLPSPRCASAAVVQGRVLLALGEPQTPTHPDRGHLTRAPLTGPVVLGLEDYMDQPGRNSWLMVQGERLMLEVMEQTEPDARPFTQAALDGVRDEVQAVLAGADELRQRGFVSAWVPPEGWTTEPTQPPLAVTPGEAGRPGRYDVAIWLNPGVPGDLSLRLVLTGPSTLGGLPDGLGVGEAVPIQHQLPRRLGWGADAGVRFGAETPLWVERGVPGEALRGRLEVVLTPDGGGAERVLAAVEQDFTGREPATPPPGGHR